LEEQLFDEGFVDAICATFVANTGMATALDLPAEECVAILKRLLIEGGAMIKVSPGPDGDRFTIAITPPGTKPPATLQ